MTKLGELINEYRLCNNLSIRQFAKKCGLSSTYIDKLEKNGKNGVKLIEPTLYALGKVANGMGLSITELMYFIENHNGLEFHSIITGEKTKIVLMDKYGESLGTYYSTMLPNKGHKISRYNQLYIIVDIVYKFTDKLEYIEIVINEVE